MFCDCFVRKRVCICDCSARRSPAKCSVGVPFRHLNGTMEPCGTLFLYRYDNTRVSDLYGNKVPHHSKVPSVNPIPRYQTPLLENRVNPLSVSAFPNERCLIIGSPVSSAHRSYSWNKSFDLALHCSLTMQRSLMKVPTKSCSTRYLSVAVFTAGGFPSPSLCQSQHPRIAQARIPSASAFNFSGSPLFCFRSSGPASRKVKKLRRTQNAVKHWTYEVD